MFRNTIPSNTIRIPFFIFLLLPCSSIANTVLFLEPYVGYGMGSMDKSVFTKNNSADRIISKYTLTNRVNHGLRFGFIFPEGPYMAITYNLERASYKEADEEHNLGKLKSKSLWGTIGYNMPINIRLWISYTISFTQNLIPSNILENEAIINGEGFLCGIGYKITPHFSLNIEYRSIRIKELIYDGKTYQSKNNPTTDLIHISVNFPFTLY